MRAGKYLAGIFLKFGNAKCTLNAWHAMRRSPGLGGVAVAHCASVAAVARAGGYWGSRALELSR